MENAACSALLKPCFRGIVAKIAAPEIRVKKACTHAIARSAEPRYAPAANWENSDVLPVNKVSEPIDLNIDQVRGD